MHTITPTEVIERLAAVANVELDTDLSTLPADVIEEVTHKLAMSVLTDLVENGKGDTFVVSLVRQYHSKGYLSDKQWPHAVRNALAQAPDPTMPDIVRNAARWGTGNRAGECFTCKHPVEEDAGFYFKGSSRWHVHHKVGECSTEPVAKLPEAGSIVKTDSGKIVKVVRSQANRLYGKVLSGVGDRGRLAWQYDSKVIHECRGAEVIDPVDVRREACVLQWGYAPGTEELRKAAVQHGVEFSACMFCGLPLTDDGDGRSVEHGYGPVCADNYGLPWG